MTVDQGENFDALNASATGRYLTDVDGGFPLIEAVTASIDCNSPGNIIEVLTAARSSAVNTFPTDVSASLDMRYHKGPTFRGTVGRPLIRPVFNLPAGTTAAGVELALPVRRGASLVIKAIHTAIAGAADFTLNVWSNDPSFEQGPILLDGAVDGKLHRHELESALVLPMHSDTMSSENRIIYRLYYTPTTNPYGTQIKCCSVTPDFRGHFRANGFAIQSGTVADKNDEYIGTSNKSMGLVLEGYSTCNVTGWLCETAEVGGYDLQGLIGDALRYKGAIYLAKHVLDTGNLNAYTLLSREAIFGLLRSYKKSYGEIVKWIAANVPSEAVDCLGCERKVLSMSLSAI